MFATGDNMATAMHIMLNSAKTVFFQYGNLKKLYSVQRLKAEQ